MQFCVIHHPLLKITIVRMADKAPKKVDRDGFELRYIAALGPQGVQGALTVIRRLDEHFGKRTKGAGVYQVPYDEVRAQLQVIMDEVPKPLRNHMIVRIFAGVAALALCFAFGFCATGGTIFWLAVCAMKRQSGLMAMAETAVVWRILDWRPMIQRLGRIALGK